MIAAYFSTSRQTPSPTCPGMIGDRMGAADCRRLEHALRAATAAGVLVLHYQPRLCLATGKIVGNEALLCWPNRQPSLTSPGIRDRVAKQSVLTDLAGTWLLFEACKEAICWNVARLSVNVSIRQLQSGILPVQLAVALEQSGLSPDRLDLEVRTSSLMDSGIDTLLALSAIRDLGIGLVLDDFGTSGVSLSVLKRLPLTAVKLDASLVRDVPVSHEDAAIARAVIDAGRAMQLTTVAAGIETEAQRAFLSGIGCDEGQGSLFSHPLAAWQLRSKPGLARA